ncbi:hypothetical protein OHC33_010591 [Knufia fluminis]|uniref:ML-like domain-containing protein n=1 Tax=Knufia fluminis TaxID=191047 RepID=A0AAN8EE38_9EURO|nr:hypothetical protein OHC33_010591 [Knufia fluminis]
MAHDDGRPNNFLQILLYTWLLLFTTSVNGAFVEFSNCAPDNVITSNPRVLQFVPLNVSAIFNTTGDSHLLNVTFYGNVTGQLYNGTYPPPDDPSWSDSNSTFGKIVDVQDGAELATTLFATYNVLSYTPYSANPSRLCENVVNEGCPLGPAFYRNSTDLSDLPGYTIAHDMGSSYAFSTIETTTKIQAGTSDGPYYACVAARITPDLGDGLKSLIGYLPLGILVVVGIATVAAAIFSPWGSNDIFHWSSNYGRDEDVLRLITPGFGDCLQYIQFVVFTGSLSLHFPGFYQPVVSELGWSSLLFNESLVTGGNGSTPVVDGIYQYRQNSNHGLDRITQLIGMTSPSDAWADMMVWLLVITASAVVLTQIGFLLQWIYRTVKDVAPEDLRSKNWYFSVGNIVRIAIGYFLLPLVALSMYQFVIASLGPTYAVALAAVVLVMIIAFASWLTYKFIHTRPRSFMFDDLQTVLLYGPLYNTYRDETATFALIPILVNLLRGIAIGAVQDSGVAQIILLAICEIILITTLNFIRPYSAATSMNVYQTCFAVLRLLTVLLSIAFVPALSVTTASRGWIGYVILLIHACVLVFGFLINAIQTLVEVIARLAGAGATGGRDVARGGLVKVFGVRQLSRRLPRQDAARNSMGSNAHMLITPSDKEEMTMARSRTRTMSGSSDMLLDGTRRKRTSHVDGSSQGRQTPDGMSTLSRLSKNLASPGAIVGLTKTESRDPYYRPPRRNTNDFITTNGKPRLSGLDQKDAAEAKEAAINDAGEGSSQLRTDRDEEDGNGAELTKTKTDYAIREVDYYYGVRGGPLSGGGGTRKMRTGPADPTGRVSSARGWFKGILGGKTKEKGKGFEVVRSAKAPPPGLMPPTSEDDKDMEVSEPYQDEPEHGQEEIVRDREEEMPRAIDDDAASFSTAGESYASPIPRAPTRPPALPAFDFVGGIELPSRINSEASRKRAAPVDNDLPPVPPVPRKSSRRTSSPRAKPEDLRAPPVAAAPLESPARSNRELHIDTTSPQQRLPFARTASSRQTNKRNSAAVSEISSYMEEPLADDIDQPQARRSQVAERPSSVGYVNQHRASDNIKYSPDEAHIPRLSTVEYGYQPTQSQQSQVQTQTNQKAPRPELEHVSSPETPWTPAWNGSSAYGDGTQRHSRFRD